MSTRRIATAIAAMLVPCSALFGQLGRPAPPNTANRLARDQALVSRGQSRFQQLCTSCHGRAGEGGQGEGQGPNLVNSWEVRRASDDELMGFIHNGIKGSAMPAFALPDEQIKELAAYVRSLNAPAISVLAPGDRLAGETVFYQKGGCGSCHMIRGRGGYLGPDLSNVGMTLRLGEIRDAILDPGRLSTDGYRPILLSGGIRGIVKHASNWSMQVLDENGQLHLLHGVHMKTAVLQKKQWMPEDYAQRLTPTEIQNVVAFLSRQAVRPNAEPQPSRRRPSAEPVN